MSSDIHILCKTLFYILLTSIFLTKCSVLESLIFVFSLTLQMVSKYETGLQKKEVTGKIHFFPYFRM